MTIKQPEGSGMCAVCVAAMATSTTCEAVYEFFNDGRVMGDPITDIELAAYLLSKGWLMGLVWNVEQNGGPVHVDHTTPLVHENLRGTPAYLGVQSRNYEGLGHAIFWDGEKVHDPDPKADGLSLGDYAVELICPLTRIRPLHHLARLHMTPASEPPLFVRQYRAEGVPKQAPMHESELGDGDEWNHGDSP